MVFFNTPEEEVSQDFEILPPGRYRLAVIDSDYKTTRKGDGKFLSVAFQVVDGRYKDRKLFDNFNLENPSEKAQKIGRGQFKRFLGCVRIHDAITDVEECHRRIANKILFADVDQEEGHDGKTRNVIRRYESTETTPAAHQAPKASGGASSSVSSDEIPF